MQPNTQEVDIAGNVCESGDLFARDRPMPDVEEWDLLAILNARCIWIYHVFKLQFKTKSI